MLTDQITALLRQQSLTREQARLSLDLMMQGKVAPAQIAAFLIALRAKGETRDEVAGCVDSLRAHMVKLELSVPHLVDGCGTGGDGTHTFNISTAASLVAAASGAHVAKHGNRSVSSRSGSADLLEAAGLALEVDPGSVQRRLAASRFVFLFAPQFHPSLKYAMPVRRELKVRTVFNLLGPLCNPAGVKRQVIGVYDPAIAPLVAEVAMATGSEHVLVVHASDGLDELSVCAPTSVTEYRGDHFATYSVSASTVGLGEYPIGSLAGGTPEENLSMLYRVLRSERGAYRDAALLNAGAMLYVAGVADQLISGVELARTAVDSGAALASFEGLIAGSRS